jgi:hypothetical protein
MKIIGPLLVALLAVGCGADEVEPQDWEFGTVPQGAPVLESGTSDLLAVVSLLVVPEVCDERTREILVDPAASFDGVSVEAVDALRRRFHEAGCSWEEVSLEQIRDDFPNCYGLGYGALKPSQTFLRVTLDDIPEGKRLQWSVPCTWWISELRSTASGWQYTSPLQVNA